MSLGRWVNVIVSTLAGMMPFLLLRLSNLGCMGVPWSVEDLTDQRLHEYLFNRSSKVLPIRPGQHYTTQHAGRWTTSSLTSIHPDAPND